MTVPDYTDDWRRYWEQAHEGGRRLELENAATEPLARWVTADASVLVDDTGIDPGHLVDHPDDMLEAARDGFQAFVSDRDFDKPVEDTRDYAMLPIHLAGVDRATTESVEFEDPVANANSVTQINSASVLQRPETAVRPAVITYRCPRGHETTLRQPLYRNVMIETCGQADCENSVVPVDRRTRPRRITEFTVTVDDERLPCLATGKFAHPTQAYEEMSGANRLLLTGIPRLVVASDGTLDPLFEVLHAESATPR